MTGYGGARGTTAPRVTLRGTPLPSTSEGEFGPCAAPEVSLEPSVGSRRVLTAHETSAKVLAAHEVRANVLTGHVALRDRAGGVLDAVHQLQVQGLGQPGEQRGAVAGHAGMHHELVFVDQPEVSQG